MIFALHAEIAAGIGAVEEQMAPSEVSYLVNDEWPFGPSDRTDFVFASLKADLTVLPQEVIHPIVRYYRLAEQSNLMIDHIERESFTRQLPEARKRYALAIVALLNTQQAVGTEALSVLEQCLHRWKLPVPQRGRGPSHERLYRSDHRSSPSADRQHIVDERRKS